MKGIDLKKLLWIGDSKENLKKFPTEVQKSIGTALFFAQVGEKHPKAKPFKDVGTGVYEIVSPFDGDTYRAVYAVKIGKNICVLHSFQKKSPKGKKTPKPDIKLIKQRYKLAVEKVK